MFADDANIFYVANTHDELSAQMQYDLNLLNDWFKKN